MFSCLVVILKYFKCSLTLMISFATMIIALIAVVVAILNEKNSPLF
ncbi:putative holin-like toxin [Gracilibacillus salinarum]